VLDCGTISEALVASELFGHERGAYTDAHERRRGRLEVAASGGTIFMDEIGNLCTAGQRALLRALEERVIYRIGSTTPIPLDMRLITATNDILVDDDEASAFRPDLFYRLSEFIIVAPPLRERPEDVEFLASRFLRQSQREHQTYARGKCAAVKKCCTARQPYGIERGHGGTHHRVHATTIEPDNLHRIACLSPTSDTPPQSGGASSATIGT
jgi:transcriptional regulator with GAF, ATPase, and Fis domain